MSRPDVFLYACSGSAVRGDGGSLEFRSWPFYIYAADDVEADHLAFEKLKVAAPAREGWRELDAKVLRVPVEVAQVFTDYGTDTCLRPGGCVTRRTCEAIGCRHAAYRGVR